MSFDRQTFESTNTSCLSSVSVVNRLSLRVRSTPLRSVPTLLSSPFDPLADFHDIWTLERQIEMAVTELDMITDVFNRLVNSCHAKCISEKYLEGDLNKGEGVCIDRCTAKFFEVSLSGLSFWSFFRSFSISLHSLPLPCLAFPCLSSRVAQRTLNPLPGRTRAAPHPHAARVRTPPLPSSFHPPSKIPRPPR